MTPPDDQVRLRHLRDAAAKAIGFGRGKTRQDLEDDELLQLALTKLVEIVGEAAKQISEAVRTEHEDVPWSEAARMRDRLVHHYFDIDLDILWATITEYTREPLVTIRESRTNRASAMVVSPGKSSRCVRPAGIGGTAGRGASVL